MRETPTRSDCSRQRGFTLVELMVTLAVFVILAMVAIPALSQLVDQRRLTGAADAIHAQILFARTEAIKRSEPVFFEIEDDAAGGWRTSVTRIPGSADLDYVIESGDFRNRISLAATSEDVFGFDPVRGIKIDAAGATLNAPTQMSISLDANRRLLVQVNPIGRVRICTEAGNLRYSACPIIVVEAEE